MAKKTTLRLAMAAAAFLTIPGLAQAQPKLLEKAGELYQSNQFAKAAELYQQALDNPEKTGTASQQDYVKAKLAYCLRVNNKMEQAEALYAEVVEDPETPADNYYHYAEILLGNGKYQEAKKWFNKFLAIEPGNEKAILMTRSCDLVASVTPFFHNTEVTAFAYNSPADDNAPIQWKGGILFSSDRPQESKMLKEKSGWTGRDYLNLYYSKLKADGTLAAPKVFSPKLDELNKNLSNATFSPDGNEIYFTRNADQLNQQNTYSLQLFKATGAGRWKNIRKLPICNPNFNYMHPALSPDGNALFFVSNKPGGTGGTDIWVAYKKDGDWDTPENLGTLVNTPFNEGFPFVDEQGRLFFCSKGHTSFGGYDIFVTEMDHFGQWLPPRNLGRPINGPLDDVAIFVADGGHSGMFTSSRDGADDDIYFFQAQPGSTPDMPQPENPPVASSTQSSQTAAPAAPASGEQPLQQEDPAAEPPLTPADPATALEGGESPTLATQPELAGTGVPTPAAGEIREPGADASRQAPSEEAKLQGQETAWEMPDAPTDHSKAAAPSLPTETTPSAGRPLEKEPASPATAANRQEAPPETGPQQPALPGQGRDGNPDALDSGAAVAPVATAPAAPLLPGQEQNPLPEPKAVEPEAPTAPVATAPEQPGQPKQPRNPESNALEPAATSSAPAAAVPPAQEKKPAATALPDEPAPVQPGTAPTAEKPAPAPSPASPGTAAATMPARKQGLENAPAPQSPGGGIATAAEHPASGLIAQTEEMKKLGSFKDLAQKLEAGSTTPEDRFRLDNASFDPNVWQLTPKVTLVLDRLAELMRQYPAVKIELSAHTESIGPEPLNLALSQKRAGIAQEYLVKDGIAKERVIIRACGESMLLNHCTDDADCSREEHLVNQRLEVRILE